MTLTKTTRYEAQHTFKDGSTFETGPVWGSRIAAEIATSDYVASVNELVKQGHDHPLQSIVIVPVEVWD